ncbi:MAG: HNH endonuclease [Parvibaculum sp.]|nr:HNH endonuclease [Parvibaculum sp.]
MPYINKKRPHKKEYQQQLARGEHEKRMERQRLRRKVDKNGKDANGNGVADKREGKDLAHKKPLSKGGSNKDGYTVKSKSKNRSFKRNSDGSIKTRQYLAGK